MGKNPPIWSSFAKSRRKVSDHLHWCGPISQVQFVEARERTIVVRRSKGDNTQHRTDRAPLWGEAVLLVRPSSRTHAPLKRGSGGAFRGVESPHSTPRCISSAQGTILGVSVPLHGDSNLGVEWRPEHSYLSEIVLPVTGSGRRRYLNSSSSSRLRQLKCADMRLLLRCIGVSLSLVLRCLGEGARGSDFWALPSTPLQYALQDSVM